MHLHGAQKTMPHSQGAYHALVVLELVHHASVTVVRAFESVEGQNPLYFARPALALTCAPSELIVARILFTRESEKK